MAEDKSATSIPSSEKDEANGKTFRIPISNGIFEHYTRLKDAMWLLSLFVDWTTKEIRTADGSLDGLVLGGKPIRDEDVAIAFGGQICARTARRWRQRLAREGYISQKRTPVGYVIRVKKSKKWARADSLLAKVNGQKSPIRTDRNVRSEVPTVSDQNGHDQHFRSTSCVRFNKDSAVQDKDRAVVEEAATTAASLLETKNPKAWDAIGLTSAGDSRFQRVWEQVYAEKATKERLSDAMERCILACQTSRIAPPKSFYDAKRSVESSETHLAKPFKRESDGAWIGNGELPRLEM